MGSIMHPAGPQAPQVYWRRRALVLAAALVVVIGLVAIVWASLPKSQPQAGSTPDPAGSYASGLPSPGVTRSTPATPAVPASSAPATPAAPQACDPLSVRTGLAGFKKLAQGSAQVFKVSLTNATAVPCVLAVSASTFSVAVTSGKDRIWNTADCAAWVPAKKVTLASQQGYVFEVKWPGVRSSSGCKTTKATVPAGVYVAKATYTGAEAARLVMVISAN
jgi:hypothetical protein